MTLEIIQLTDKGWALSKNVRHSGNEQDWRCVYFLGRLGGSAEKARIANALYGGNYGQTNAVLRDLRVKGVVK